MIASSFAGPSPSAKVVAAPVLPTPYLYQWFAGGTAGYLVDSECEFFSGHVGTSLNHSVFGWNASTYLEVGYFNCDEHWSFEDQGDVGTTSTENEKECEIEVNDVEDGEFGSYKFDLDVVPVTLNYKLERQISNSFNLYFGVGAGAAFMDLDSNYAGSDDDVVFFAQAFTGVLYNVNESFELFAGGRVIYFDDPSFNFGGDVSIDDAMDIDNVDGIVELGARYNF